MRAKSARRAFAKAKAVKHVRPFADDIQMRAIACNCGGKTWAAGFSEDGRIALQCTACRFTGEIVAEGLTTVKKAA